MARGGVLIRRIPLACLLLATACSDAAPVLDRNSGAVVAAVPVADASVAGGALFPSYLGTTGKGCSYPADDRPPILDEFGSDWYSSALKAAGEQPLPSLAADAPDKINVRFIWLRSFNKPMIVRIREQDEGRAVLEAKRLSGRGGYEPGQVEETLARDLTLTESRAFRSLLEASGLSGEPAANCDAGLDGARWVLEVIDDGKYAFFDRWSPENGAVRDVGLAMLQLTGFDLEPIY
jgi:hypothetical protein